MSSENSSNMSKRKNETEMSQSTKAPVNESKKVRDYSDSGSSWTPSGSDDDVVSSSEDEVDQVPRIKIRKDTSCKMDNKNVFRPNNKADAIKVANQRRRRLMKLKSTRGIIKKRKILRKKKLHSRRQIPTQLRVKETCDSNSYNPLINPMFMNYQFKDLIGKIGVLKTAIPTGLLARMKAELNVQPQQEGMDFVSRILASESSDTPQDETLNGNSSPESSRSGDNVLITNKYNKVPGKILQPGREVQNQTLQEVQDNEETPEWVPIGSGKTLIHRDDFRKVNFRTYSLATRTLLLTLFPRKVLATHCLTGKSSPAFKNKPAKMCLDPKKVSDIIEEVSSRFDIRESFIRSIITTKCADEAKMYKMRLEKQKKTRQPRTKNQEGDDQENIPPQEPQPSTSGMKAKTSLNKKK